MNRHRGTGRVAGELQVRGPWIARSYYNDDRSAESFTDDGWLRTGDVATCDSEGYIRLVDRTKDVVKSGGEWISSVELENEIMGHPAVAEAAVIGVSHPKWGERPLACVVVKAGEDLTKEEVLDHLEGRVAKWWMPDDVVFIDEVPKTVGRQVLEEGSARPVQGLPAPDGLTARWAPAEREIGGLTPEAGRGGPSLAPDVQVPIRPATEVDPVASVRTRPRRHHDQSRLLATAAPRREEGSQPTDHVSFGGSGPPGRTGAAGDRLIRRRQGGRVPAGHADRSVRCGPGAAHPQSEPGKHTWFVGDDSACDGRWHGGRREPWLDCQRRPVRLRAAAVPSAVGNGNGHRAHPPDRDPRQLRPEGPAHRPAPEPRPSGHRPLPEAGP